MKVTPASNSGVAWSVNGVLGGNATVGTMSTQGLYTAPTVLPSRPTVTVAATSTADPSVSDQAAVTLVSGVSISVSPSGALVSVSQNQQFSATVIGSSNTSVTWSVNGVAGGNSTVGTVSAGGLYAAPAVVPSPSSVTITATSAADATKSAQATITIANGVSVSVSPANASVSLSQTQQFGVTVSGSANTAVTWTVNGVTGGNSAVGTISTGGLYTAPAALPSPPTVTVAATSVADTTKSAQANITVVAAPLTVSPSNTTVGTMQSVQFTAKSSSRGGSAKYTWGVNGINGGNSTVGTINNQGVYTAPAIPPNPSTTTITVSSSTSENGQANATVVPVSVSVSPTNASVVVSQTQQFTATVTNTSNTTVTWSVNGVTGGNSTLGMISTAGLYTAPSAVPSGAVIVTATSAADSTKSAQAAVTVLPAISVTISPTSGSVRMSQTQQFTATVTGSSNTSVIWTVNGVTGGNSTVGTISSSGLYTAPSLLPSPSGVTITAASTVNTSAQASAMVTITSSPVSITTSALPNGQVSSVYSVTVGAAGGTAPYSWTIASGLLPSGVGVSTDTGTISGIPSTAGTYTVTVQVSDAAGAMASQAFTFAIAAMLSVPSATLPTGSVGTSYTATITPSGGTPPATIALSTGQLPPGLNMASTGTIGGTPATAGSYNFAVQATDAKGATASQSFTILINSGNVTITPATLPSGSIGVGLSIALQASGGTAPYSWSVTTGQPPAGLTLSAGGTLSGAPTTAGPTSFTVQVVDANGSSALVPYSMNIASSQGAPALGIYGGLYNTTSGQAATGHYALTKKNNRWFFQDPQAHLFWGLQVYIAGAEGDQPYQANIINKYGSTAQWAAAQPARMRSFGFNSVADDSATNLTGINGGLPFTRMVNGSDYAMRPPTAGGSGVKNIYAGNTNFSGYLGEAADMYDPEFATSYQGSASYDQYGTNVLPTTPWLIAVTTDDADYVFGVKDGPGTNCGNPHYHSAYMVARANPVVTQYIGPSSNHQQTYSNTMLYTKYAWRDYLKSLPQYQTNGSPDIAELNAAWGSTYTTWDCQNMNGSACTGTSWGAGTGLLDENGSSPWMGTDAYGLTDANPGFVTDANGFLYQMWQKYAQITANAIRAYIPTAIVFGPASMGACTRPQVLQAMSSNDPTRPGNPLIDVFEIGTTWTLDYSKLTAIYDLTGRPIVLWDSYLANADSGMSANSCSGWGQLCLATQAQRGAAYSSSLPNIANVTGSNGDYPILGLRWWQWSDNTSEDQNFGLVSVMDNAYDGMESVNPKVPCTTTPSLTCGGEAGNYGSLLGAMESANSSLMNSLQTTYWSPAPEGPNKALSKPTTASSVWGASCAGGCIASQGVDGNEQTRWSSIQNDTEWYQVDLINTYNLASVSIEWSVASPGAYSLLGSTDGVNWTTLASRSGMSALADHQILTDTFAVTPVRYLKFQGISRASDWGYSFYELSAFE